MVDFQFVLVHVYESMCVDQDVWHLESAAISKMIKVYLGMSWLLLSHRHSLIFQMTIQEKMSEQSKEQHLKTLQSVLQFCLSS